MAEDKTVIEEITDDDLAAAWESGDKPEAEKKPAEEAKPEEKKEEVKPETKPEDKKPPEEKPASAEVKPEETKENLDHKESSHLGRKVKGLEDTIKKLQEQLEAAGQGTAEKVKVPEVIASPEDIDAYLEAKNQTAREESIKYQKVYLQVVQGLAKGNEDMHDEVMAEILSETSAFNKRHSSDPTADATRNYYAAQSFLLKKKFLEAQGKPKLPARETEKAPVGPAASATVEAKKSVSLPKLDAEAQQYVDYLRKKGMSEEEIAKELAD